MHRRSGNNPRRRVVRLSDVSEGLLKALAESASYAGSGHHKRNPADYGLERTNPRPTKSLCDGNRAIGLAEAVELLRNGIALGMISEPDSYGFPKYVWSVTKSGEVFEAKTDPRAPGPYHGYPLENEDDMKRYIRALWDERCATTGK